MTFWNCPVLCAVEHLYLLICLIMCLLQRIDLLKLFLFSEINYVLMVCFSSSALRSMIFHPKLQHIS